MVHTSKEPKQRARCPITPASSLTSRIAAELESSFGSRPPPGTIHLSLSPLEVTSKIYSPACSARRKSRGIARTVNEEERWRSVTDGEPWEQMQEIGEFPREWKPAHWIILDKQNQLCLPHLRVHCGRIYTQLSFWNRPHRMFLWSLAYPWP